MGPFNVSRCTRILLLDLLFLVPACAGERAMLDSGSTGVTGGSDGQSIQFPDLHPLQAPSDSGSLQAPSDSDLLQAPSDSDLLQAPFDGGDPIDTNPPASACSPGQTQSCYSGPAGTAGVGVCKLGTRTCAASATWGPCTGEVVPDNEVANNSIDEDCDGMDKVSCFEKDFGKLTFDCSCDQKKLTCPTGYHRTAQRYTGTGDECSWEEHDTWAVIECCAGSCSDIHDADHTYITCCPD